MAVDNSEQIAAIREALAMGARKVVFHSGGTRREIEYPSMKDMLDALERLKVQQTPRNSMTYGAFRLR